jgi:hypothetical protein
MPAGGGGGGGGGGGPRMRYSGSCASGPESRIPNLYTWELSGNLWLKNQHFFENTLLPSFVTFGSGVRDPGSGIGRDW